MELRIFISCWTVYAVSYLCRTNLAITMPAMSRDLGFGLPQGGLLGLGFFWAYAMGQLFNGYIGDRVDPRRLIATGLALSGLLNILMGTIGGLWQGIAVWTLNGFALSMLWGPTMKIVSAMYDGQEAERKAVLLSYSMIGGYVVAWGVVGRLISIVGWRWAFWLPGAVGMLGSGAWLMVSRSLHMGPITGGGRRAVPVALRQRLPSWLILVSLACTLQGVAKDGISLWGPTLLQSAAGLSQSSLSSLSLLIPGLTVLGVFASGQLNRVLPGRTGVSIAVLMWAAAVVGFILTASLQGSAVGIAIALGLLLALAMGANALMLGVVPLAFKGTGLVSWAAGFLDFSSYLGSALSGVVTAAIAQGLGWSAVCVFWSLACLASGAIAFSSSRRLSPEVVSP